MIEFLELKLSEDDVQKLKQEQKRTMNIEDEHVSVSKSKSLEEHFFECEIKETRNDSIRDAFEDGYKQSEIARYLKLSTGLISMVIKKKIED